MISVVCSTIRQSFMDSLLKNFENQTVKDKELIVLLHSDAMDVRLWQQRAQSSPQVSIYSLSPNMSLGECLNFGVEKAAYDTIAKFDDDDYYAPEYLNEVLLTLRDTGAPVVGKRYYHIYLEQYRALVLNGQPRQEDAFVAKVAGPTLAFRRAVFDKVRFAPVSIGEDTQFQDSCRRHGFRIRSSSRYHFTRILKADPQHHTWKVNADKFLKTGKVISYTDDYKPYVLPV